MPEQFQGKDRLIVALDVSTKQEARELVGVLDNVSWFKVGQELLGSWEEATPFIDDLAGRGLFVDLKLGDISETVRRTVAKWSVRDGIKFLTLSNSLSRGGLEAAAEGRGNLSELKLLFVSHYSSQDAVDFEDMYGRPRGDFHAYIKKRCRTALDSGCDGLVASGAEIGILRKEFGKKVTIVSPGIRPVGSPTHDHKRFTTPKKAIELGADYIVVGRPIRDDSNPRDAAQRIIDEVDAELSRRKPPPGSGQGNYPAEAMYAKPDQT